MADKGVANPALVSELCVTCGHCCSGAIFDHADLKDGEGGFVAAIGMKAVADPKTGALMIALPCPHLCGSLCSIHDKPRPAVCGAFFCKLARAVDRKEIALDAAKQRVAGAHALLAKLHPLMHPDETYVDVRRRWLALMPAAMAEPANAPLHAVMVALTRLFDLHFRWPGTGMIGMQDSKQAN